MQERWLYLDNRHFTSRSLFFFLFFLFYLSSILSLLSCYRLMRRSLILVRSTLVFSECQVEEECCLMKDSDLFIIRNVESHRERHHDNDLDWIANFRARRNAFIVSRSSRSILNSITTVRCTLIISILKEHTKSRKIEQDSLKRNLEAAKTVWRNENRYDQYSFIAQLFVQENDQSIALSSLSWVNIEIQMSYHHFIDSFN